MYSGYLCIGSIKLVFKCPDRTRCLHDLRAFCHVQDMSRPFPTKHFTSDDSFKVVEMPARKARIAELKKEKEEVSSSCKRESSKGNFGTGQSNQFSYWPRIESTPQMEWNGKARGCESAREEVKIEEDHGEGKGCSLYNEVER